MRIISADTYDGPVNIGSTVPVSCVEIARLCLELAGAKGAEIVTNPAEPSGVLARNCDNTKYAAVHGTPHETPHAEGFANFMAWLDRPKTATRTPKRNTMRPTPQVR